MFKRDIGIGLALVVAFAILLGVNLMASLALGNLKIDMTEQNIYTLSKGSKSMLSKLDDAVQVKVFYSRRPANNIPAIKQYADRTIEMLRQFVAASDGRLTLEVLEPLPDTQEEEWAVKYGLRPLPAEEPLYLGLVAVSETGAEKTIPFLDPQREGFLEYDIARAVSAVSHPKRKTVGIMSPLPVVGGVGDDPMARMQQRPPTPSWAFVEELRQSYDVKEVKTSVAEIESNIDLLMVIHPKNLPDQAQYAIDQYIVKGGKALIFVDGHCENEMQNNRNPDPQSRFQATFDSNLPKLFDKWGIEMVTGKVIGDRTTGANVNTGQEIKKYIIWLMLKKDSCNQEDLISSDLEQITIGSAGALKKKGDSKYQITPLLESPPTAMLVDSFILKLGADPDELNKNYVPGNEKLGIAYKLMGKFETAFPEGKPVSKLPREPGQGESEDEAKSDAEAAKNHVNVGEKDTSVLVVSDVDMLTDQFAVRVQDFFGRRMITIPYDNLNLVFNAIENFTGSEDLIGLRTRGKSARPFTTVDRIEMQAQDKWKAKEDELRANLEKANQNLQNLQRGKNEGERAVLSAEQMKEVEKFQQEKAKNLKELREVRRNLRQDIESLGSRLKFVNIALMPFLFTLLSFMPSMWRSYRVRSSRG